MVWYGMVRYVFNRKLETHFCQTELMSNCLVAWYGRVGYLDRILQTEFRSHPSLYWIALPPMCLILAYSAHVLVHLGMMQFCLITSYWCQGWGHNNFWAPNVHHTKAFKPPELLWQSMACNATVLFIISIYS